MTKNFTFTTLVAGGLVAAALGLAGHAAADASDDNTGSYTSNAGSYSFVARPNTYASPAPNLVPWASWVERGGNADSANNIYADLVSTAAHP